MKYTFILFTGLFLSTVNHSSAQTAKILRSGTIKYEKTINMYAVIKQQLGKNPDPLHQQLYDQFKKTQPQFLKLNSTLLFNQTKALFSPASSQIPPTIFNAPLEKQVNEVYSDFPNGSLVIQKNIFDNLFLFKKIDRKIKWKITNEVREIAGYTCRRANGLILDSIYIVAFYTDKIHVSSGPESFNGLPGMILGVVLPHENISWFAQKVTDQSISNEAISPPSKGKGIALKDLNLQILDAIKNKATTNISYYLKIFML